MNPSGVHPQYSTAAGLDTATDATGLDTRASRERRAFDAGFAVAPHRGDEDHVDLLAIRVGSEPYALRLAELSGLQLRRKIVPLPGADGALLGIGGYRGHLVPIYSLAGLLGYGEMTGENRWLAFYGQEQPLALAFAAFTGHHRAAISALRRLHSGERHEALDEIVALGGVTCPVIHLQPLLARLQRPAASL